MATLNILIKVIRTRPTATNGVLRKRSSSCAKGLSSVSDLLSRIVFSASHTKSFENGSSMIVDATLNIEWNIDMSVAETLEVQNGRPIVY